MAANALDRNTKLAPQLLTINWLKQGAPFSRTAAGKSLAESLLALEAAFNKIDADALQPSRKAGFASLAELEAAEKSAKQVYRSRVVPLVTCATEVRQQALIAAKLCLADPQYAATARPVAEIAKAATELADDFKDLNALFKPFDDARSVLVKAADHVKKLLSPHLQALAKGLAAGQKTPTRALWDKQCKGPCAAIHNAIRNTPQLKDEFWDVWKVHDGESFSHALQVAEKSAGTDTKAQQKLAEVIVRMCKDLTKELVRLEGFLKS